MSPCLYILAINARRAILCRHASHAGFVLAVIVDVFEVEGVEVAREEPVESLVGVWDMEGREPRDGSYPRSVRQMLMRRSAPQPAMRKTPRGGTGGETLLVGYSLL